MELTLEQVQEALGCEFFAVKNDQSEEFNQYLDWIRVSSGLTWEDDESLYGYSGEDVGNGFDCWFDESEVPFKIFTTQEFWDKINAMYPEESVYLDKLLAELSERLEELKGLATDLGQMKAENEALKAKIAELEARSVPIEPEPPKDKYVPLVQGGYALTILRDGECGYYQGPSGDFQGLDLDSVYSIFIGNGAPVDVDIRTNDNGDKLIAIKDLRP